MKSLLRFVPSLLLLLAVTHDARAESLPEYRPALLGHHKRSLVNLINTESLMKRGQGDAITMFSCSISVNGFSGWSIAYRSSPNSEKFQKELLARIDQAQFEPAIYKHAKVAVYVSGTASFFVRDGKPRLRIFLNQEEGDLESGRDFIAPQFAFAPGNPAYKGIFYPPGACGQAGVASLLLDVSADGGVQSSRVIYEHPPAREFGAYSAGPIRKATFIPGFRNGKPVACRFTWSLIFTGPGRQMKTG